MEQIGKKKCEILKDIRKKIAVENGIEYNPTECHHQGDCNGTCPKCDGELRYLQNEINKKKALGSTPSIAASAIGGILTATMLASCNGQVKGEMEPYVLEGDVPAPITIIDSTMVGNVHEVSYYDEKDSTHHSGAITITKEMIGESLEFPDSGSAVRKAIDELKNKKQ